MKITILENSVNKYAGIRLSDYNDGNIMLIQNGLVIIINDEHIELVIAALSDALDRRK